MCPHSSELSASWTFTLKVLAVKMSEIEILEECYKCKSMFWCKNGALLPCCQNCSLDSLHCWHCGSQEVYHYIYQVQFKLYYQMQKKWCILQFINAAMIFVFCNYHTYLYHFEIYEPFIVFCKLKTNRLLIPKHGAHHYCAYI